MLLGLDHKPIPPTDVVGKLQQLSSNLGLQFYNYPKPCWALTWRWPETDQRRELIRTGQMNLGDDFDILTWLPQDCSPDDAVGYAERSLLRFGGRKQEVNALLDKIQEHNLKQIEVNMQPTLELAEELFKTNVGTLFSDEGKTLPKNRLPDRKAKAKDEARFKEWMLDGGSAEDTRA